MKICKTYGNLELQIEDNLLIEMSEIAVKHYPNEFGGFLLGHYSEDFKALYVKQYMLPKKYIGRPSIFQRYITGLRSIFLKVFTEEQIYYVGEWHSHPDGAAFPSNTDLTAMKNIASSSSVHINNPVLLILSIGRTEMKNYNFFYLRKDKLYRYE